MEKRQCRCRLTKKQKFQLKDEDEACKFKLSQFKSCAPPNSNTTPMADVAARARGGTGGPLYMYTANVEKRAHHDEQTLPKSDS